MERQVEEFRTTRETDIALKLDLDGTGRYEITRAWGFLTICWRALPGMACLIWM